MNKKDSFTGYLERKGLSIITIDHYIEEFDIFYELEKKYGLSQEVVDVYIRKAKRSFIMRAFMKNYLDFMKRRDIEILKLTGRKPEKVIKRLNPDQIRAIYKNIIERSPNKKHYLMIKLTYECGLRASEVIGIKTSDFYWDHWVDNPSNPGQLKIRGKGSKERDVMIKPTTMRELAHYAKTYLMESKSDKFFPDAGYKSLQAKFSKAKKDLGYDCSLHTLRHAAALQWYKEGKSLVNIKTRLGHSSISTTQIYVNPDKEEELKSWGDELKNG